MILIVGNVKVIMGVAIINLIIWLLRECKY